MGNHSPRTTSSDGHLPLAPGVGGRICEAVARAIATQRPCVPEMVPGRGLYQWPSPEAAIVLPIYLYVGLHTRRAAGEISLIDCAGASMRSQAPVHRLAVL